MIIKFFPVLKGRWKHWRPHAFSIVLSGRTLSLSEPDTSCLANFRRRFATKHTETRDGLRLNFIISNTTFIPQTFWHMPSTHLNLHFHIVFSTKDRHPFIADAWRARLHEYLGGLVRAADGIPEAIGGTADHVHILAGLRATHSLATFVQDIKQTSSH